MTVGNGCGQPYTLSVYVTDSANQTSTTSSASATTNACPPQQSVSVAWGSNPAQYGNWLNVTVTGFSPGTYQFYCEMGGTQYGPYTTTVSSSPQTYTKGTCFNQISDTYVIFGSVASNTVAHD